MESNPSSPTFATRLAQSPQRYPAVIIALAFAAGILGAFVQEKTTVVSLIIGMAGIVIWACMVFNARTRPYAIVPLILPLFALGSMSFVWDGVYRPPNAVERFANDTLQVSLTGIVAERPNTRDRSISFWMEAETLYIGGAATSVDGMVAVSMFVRDAGQNLIPVFKEGTRVRAQGMLDTLQDVRNPGEFDYSSYLKLHGVYARYSVDSMAGCTVIRPRAYGGFRQAMCDVRAHVDTVIESIASGQEAEIVRGLVVGERGDLSAGVKEAFMNTGLMHILAISGFNVGLVVLVLGAGLSVVRIRSWFAWSVTSLGLIAFGMITGAQPSVMRAVVMGILFFAGRLVQRRSDIYNTLAIAALVLIVADARTLFDPGFQLSFSAIFGMAYLYPKFEQLANSVRKSVRSNPVWRFFTVSIAVSIAATLGTLPLTLIYFHRVSFSGIALNLAAIPISSAILGTGFFAVVVGAFSLAAAQVVGTPAAILAHWLLVLASRGAEPLWSHLTVGDAGIWAWVILFALLYLGFGSAKGLPGRLLICVCLGVNVWLVTRAIRLDAPQATVTFLDVGQGDAAVLRTAHGKTVVIDCGPASRYSNAGARVLLPYLRSVGSDSIDLLVLTHPHLDHIGGCAGLIGLARIHTVVQIDAPAENGFVAGLKKSLLTVAGGGIHPDSAGMVIPVDDDTRLYVLHPSGRFRNTGDQDQRGLNNRSLVLKLLYGNASILFSGDAQTDAELRISALYNGFLNSEILKVGHHGAANASSVRYLRDVSPQWSVISCGIHNRFGHPAQGTIDRLLDVGSQIHRTDLAGAAEFISDGNSWKPVEWRR